MQKTIQVRVGSRMIKVPAEVLVIDHALWEVQSPIVVSSSRSTRIFAQSGDLIRVFTRTGRKASKVVYSSYNLSTLRRAETNHIREGELDAFRQISYWSAELLSLASLLNDWKNLSDKEKQAIKGSLRDFVGAFWGVKAWQQELALAKVINHLELTDRLNRPNPQGVGRALLAARARLIEYQRVVRSGLSKGARIASVVEQIHLEYKQRFATVRKFTQLGYSKDADVSAQRIETIKEALVCFQINPWRRPAQESLRFVELAELQYKAGNRAGANRILRSIPGLFSAESRLSRVVETIHRVDIFSVYGSQHDGRSVKAADLIHNSKESLRRLAGKDHLGNYQVMASELWIDLSRAEHYYRQGRIAEARSLLKKVEDRIRSRVVS